MHEEINEKSMTLAARVGKATADELRKAIEKLLADLKNRSKTNNTVKSEKTPELKHGKQTLKQLSKHHDGLSAVELKEPQLRLLYREMKRHNVDFTAVRDGKGKYTLFFKGKDADSITHAFNRYTAKVVKRDNKRSIGKDLAATKAALQKLNQNRDKEKNRSKGARDR
jgi:predicted DNA-binding protein